MRLRSRKDRCHIGKDPLFLGRGLWDEEREKDNTVPVMEEQGCSK